MANIVFVPPIDFTSIFTPIGVSSLATVLEEKHDVTCINYGELFSNGVFTKGFSKRDDLVRVTEYILSLNPDVVGFSSVASDFHVHLYIAREIKTIDSGIKIIFGGPAASAAAHETIDNFYWVDAVAIGEAENNVMQLVDCLLHKHDYDSVKGVVFQGQENNGKSYQVVFDLSTLCSTYYDTNFNIAKLGEKYFPLETGRGCPFQCIFCRSSTLSKDLKYRRKSNEQILTEICFLYNEYGVDRFYFTHDLFTFNRNAIMEFCTMIQERELNIKWFAYARIDAIDKCLLKVMIDCGCTNLFFGIESGSERIQKLIKKNLQIKSIYENIDLIKSVGMHSPEFSFIYGYPEESDKDLEQTMNIVSYMVQKGFFSIEMNKLTVFRSSELFESLKRKGCFERDLQPIVSSPWVFYLDCTKDIYMDKIEIFPHLFQLDTHTINKYPLLDSFISVAVCTFVKYHKSSSVLLFSNGAALLLMYQLYEDYLSTHELNIYTVSIDRLEEIFLHLAYGALNEDFLAVFIGVFNFEKGVRLIRSGELEESTFKTIFDLTKVREFINHPLEIVNCRLDKECTVTLTRTKNGIIYSMY